MDPARSSIGSYGFAIKALAEGLSLAKSEGWMSDSEARRELRGHVRSIQANKQRDQLVKELREQADELEQQADEDD